MPNAASIEQRRREGNTYLGFDIAAEAEATPELYLAPK
jgi:hypothetical protein